MPHLAALESNQVSCISSGCHDMIHNASEVGHLKMWTGGAVASDSSSTPPAKAKSAAAAAPSKASVGGSAGKTAASGGKAIFDSHGCGGCHGATGGGGSGPALTQISSQYPRAKLTALLKAPTGKMKTAGMAALTVNAADMKALVAYLGSLGGKSAASATTPSASAAAAAAPSKEGTAAEYHNFCASCHGDTGAGNGSAAVGFDPSPANFTDCAKMKSHSDEFLYEVVAKGGSTEGLSPTMPEWSIAFTDSQMHGLVEYVRSFCR